MRRRPGEAHHDPRPTALGALCSTPAHVDSSSHAMTPLVLRRVACLVVGLVLGGSGGVPGRLRERDVASYDTYRTPDGHVDVYVAQLKDGGALMVQRDGGARPLQVRRSSCDADAGVLFALLAQRSCTQASDCAVVRPELRTFDCCYAVEKVVAQSQALDEEMTNLGRACGRVTMLCPSETCDRAVCRNGKCVLAGPRQ